MSRLTDFTDYLVANAIPISGAGQNGDPPDGVTINFLPAATAEQIAWAEQAKQTWDWRPRRLLTRSQLATAIAGITTAQQNALMRHLLALFIRSNRGEVLRALLDTSLPIAIDEVDPNP